MRALAYILGVLFSVISAADTIEHYMNIVKNIPMMEMKADPHAQAWARSARNVLVITNETIAETLLEANKQAEKSGHPLFCLPEKTALDASNLKTIMESTYEHSPEIQQDKYKLTVSEVALIAVNQTYPCKGAKKQTAFEPLAVPSMQHEQG